MELELELELEAQGGNPLQVLEQLYTVVVMGQLVTSVIAAVAVHLQDMRLMVTRDQELQEVQLLPVVEMEVVVVVVRVFPVVPRAAAEREEITLMPDLLVGMGWLL